MILVKQSLHTGSQDILLTDFQNLKNTSNYLNNETMQTFYNNVTSRLNNSLLRMETSDTISDYETPNNINKSILIYHGTCLNHCKLSETDHITRVKQRTLQVENPDRLNVLLQPPFGIFHSDFLKSRFNFREVSKPATLADILLVHEYNYVESIRTICEDLKRNDPDGIVKYGIYI